LREESRLRVFENRLLRKMHGITTDEATGELRKLHNEQLHDLSSSPNIVNLIKSRRMRWVVMWQVWRRGGVHTRFWWGDREGDHLEDPGVDGWIILKRIFKKWDREAGTGSNWLRIEIGRGLL
jgi:hypothetical protein